MAERPNSIVLLFQQSIIAKRGLGCSEGAPDKRAGLTRGRACSGDTGPGPAGGLRQVFQQVTASRHLVRIGRVARQRAQHAGPHFAALLVQGGVLREAPGPRVSATPATTATTLDMAPRNGGS